MIKEANLDFLLKYLLAERREVLTLPKTFSEKWRLYRSLVNIRAPKAVSADFLSAEDELLKALIAEKGITDVNTLIPVKDGIYLWRGDITTLKADAIVNAANSGMLGCFAPCHGCIDNAIHTYAGVQLRQECAQIMQAQGNPEPTGKAKLTNGYNLPAKYILHTVGPIVSGALTEQNKKDLAGCYRSCLETAENAGIGSIAFCCISTGEFRFPNRAAAEIVIETVGDFMKNNNSAIKVIFNVFTERDESIYKELLG